MKLRVRVGGPCNVPWDAMRRNGGSRHCGSCARSVFDLSRATETEALAVLMLHGGQLCARIAPDENGDAVWRRAARAPNSAGALAGLALGAMACATPSPAAPASPAPLATVPVAASASWQLHVEPPFVDSDDDGFGDAIDKCPQAPGVPSEGGCPVALTGV